MHKINQSKSYLALISVILALLLVLLATYAIPREQAVTWVLVFTGAYALFLFGSWSMDESNHIAWILGIAVLVRLFLLPNIPLLSDDYYRYIWDGQLSASGLNPFLYKPADLISKPDFVLMDSTYTQNLYSGLNSPAYHTVYPPLLQFIFKQAAIWGGANIGYNTVILRLWIILAELGTLFFLYQYVLDKGLKPKLVLLYALNPLVLVEFTANLHAEVYVVLGISMMLWASTKVQLGQVWALMPYVLGAGIAIGTKLIPVVFVPFVIMALPKNIYKIWAALGILICSTLTIWPLYNALAQTGSSFSLYFTHFEYNASLYYLLRAAGYWIKGYNAIAWLGPMCMGLFVLAATWLWFKFIRIKHELRLNQLPQYLALTHLLYYLCSTTVHPWYVAGMLVWVVLAAQYWPLVWAFGAALTYLNYHTGQFHEHLWLVSLEYVLLGFYLVFAYKQPLRWN